MSDSTINLEQIETAQASKEVTANQLFDAASPAMIFGRHAEECSGLTFSYYGGRYGGTLVANGANLCDASTVTYMVVDRASAAVSFSTASTDWSDTTNFARAYLITTGADAVTSYEDHRAGANGTQAGGGTGGTGGATRNSVSVVTPASGVANIDVSLGDYFTLAPTANVTSITFSNLPGSGNGASLMLLFTQDSTPRTVAWPASFKWEAGIAPAVSTGSGAHDLLALTTLDNGTTWQATLSKGRA